MSRCPVQHRENALANLAAYRIVREKAINLLPRDLTIGGKAFRNVAGPTPLNDAAQFLLGCEDREWNHPPSEPVVPVPPYSAVNNC